MGGLPAHQQQFKCLVHTPYLPYTGRILGLTVGRRASGFRFKTKSSGLGDGADVSFFGSTLDGEDDGTEVV